MNLPQIWDCLGPTTSMSYQEGALHQNLSKLTDMKIAFWVDEESETRQQELPCTQAIHLGLGWA